VTVVMVCWPQVVGKMMTHMKSMPLAMG
jgi:hypothetical protein